MWFQGHNEATVSGLWALRHNVINIMFTDCMIEVLRNLPQVRRNAKGYRSILFWPKMCEIVFDFTGMCKEWIDWWMNEWMDRWNYGSGEGHAISDARDSHTEPQRCLAWDVGRGRTAKEWGVSDFTAATSTTSVCVCVGHSCGCQHRNDNELFFSFLLLEICRASCLAVMFLTSV